MSETWTLPGCEPMGSTGSTLSAADSPARTSALPARAPVLLASEADYGASLRESLATFDRDSSSWRTSQLCLVEGTARFLETWPRSGMTLSGTAFRLPPLARLIAATESGSLLPTPSHMQAAGSASLIAARRDRERAKGRNGNGFGLNLAQAAVMGLLPTPVASDAYGSGSRNTPTSRAHPGLSLTDWARGDGGGGRGGAPKARSPWGLLPTPRAAEWKGTGPIGSASHSHRLSRGYLDATMQEATGTSGRLNPRFVEWMMGFPPDWTDPDSKLSATQLCPRSSK